MGLGMVGGFLSLFGFAIFGAIKYWAHDMPAGDAVMAGVFISWAVFTICGVILKALPNSYLDIIERGLSND